MADRPTEKIDKKSFVMAESQFLSSSSRAIEKDRVRMLQPDQHRLIESEPPSLAFLLN